ncbi:exporter of polyketide antibiotics [Winogradskya consettensis]|uniref:Exporter of polyketide antibiotics n=1 Tax=Winogradskya consettensis TaxID=113560 RepID=A0A919S8Z1_9ACTN|nr:ABC transporter permease [Actinoplanes consettensis]GIM66970.1 exporter of polyketide antibiotics [Actinoplanes consettensis]
MTGTGTLIRLILRRDRVLLPLWAILVALIPAGYVSSFKGLFPTDSDLAEYARVSMSSPGFIALYGPLRGDNLGEIVAWRAGFFPVIIGLISLLTVIRHTRTEEEAGRTELIGSGIVGRHAAFAAALITTAGANLVLFAIISVTMIGQGQPAVGSVLLGLSFAMSGCVFAALGAVTAQLSGSARVARSIAIVGLGVAFVLRLAGDVDTGVSWLSWVSPIGWVQHVFAYGENDVLPLLLALLLVVGLVFLGSVLVSRRDVGEGLITARPGPATGTITGPIGLAWRLHRGVLTGWLLGFAALGLVFGGVAASIADLAADNPDLTAIFQRLGGNSFLVGMVAVLGLIAAAYGVQAALRLRDEEATGHTEAILATRVGRLRWLTSHLMFSLLGPAAALLVGGLLCGLTAGGHQLPTVLRAAAAQLPAVWVLTALTVLLFGVFPRQASAAWGAVAACFLILMVGAVLRLDQWILDLSPFTHVSHGLSATPFLTLTAIAAILATTGTVAFRHRDIPSA